MSLTAGRYVALILALCTGLLLASAALIYRYDPFEHYRQSAILPTYSQESYHNPGIAKNYAYDAAILGTSMVEMSRPSTIDAAFGVRSVKLPMRGSHTAQMGWQLSHILDDREMKLVILAVDAYSLQGPPEDREEIVEYLWNDALLDDVNYLLNGDVLLVHLPRMLLNRGKSLAGQRDAMYQWVDVVFSEQSVLQSTSFRSQGEMIPADTRQARTEENLRRHLIPAIEGHPQTRFLVYMPPYSAAYWYGVTRGGLFLQQARTRELVAQALLGYENVELYDFSSRLEWIEDLDQYFDYSHHSTEISDRLIRAMAAGEGRLRDAAQMEEGTRRIEEAVERFAARYEPASLR